MSFYPPSARIAGRYEVVGRPLLGGMGIVYVCLDREADRPVALKTFRPEYLPNPAARERFLREGTHWVELGVHPHIVRCYQVVRIDPEVYLVLELVAKELGREDASLRTWLNPGVPLPVEMALLFGLQVVRGMQHAVETIPGFVHRDLKPENVLVGADRLSEAAVNRVRVTDFGLAAVVQVDETHVSEPLDTSAPQSSPGSTQLTEGGVGTPLYMAPEQWRGGLVTEATDIYALGGILYELVTGQQAVEGRSLASLRQAHCEGQRRPLPSWVPTEVSKVISRCLAVEPRARYARWSEVEEALVMTYEEMTDQRPPNPIPAESLKRQERVAKGWSYNAIGNSYLDLGESNVALGQFEIARALGEAEGAPVLVGAALANLGIAYAQLSDIQRAIGHLEKALTIARRIGDRRGEGAVLGNLGIAYMRLGDARSAVGYHEQHLAIAREIGDRHAEGNAMGNLGSAYLQLGEVPKAVGYYEQALVIERQIGNVRGESADLSNLGVAYSQLGDVRRAIGCHERALAIARHIGDRQGESDALGGLGNAYFQLGNARRAAGFYAQVLAIARETRNRRVEGAALGNLGNTYYVLGKPQQALEYWQRSGPIKDEIGDMMGSANTSFNLAVLLAEQERFSEALVHARRAAQIFAQIGHSQMHQRTQQLMAEIQAGLR